jgi:hypothetical protein
MLVLLKTAAATATAVSISSTSDHHRLAAISGTPLTVGGLMGRKVNKARNYKSKKKYKARDRIRSAIFFFFSSSIILASSS